jgi:hypothetical protein
MIAPPYNRVMKRAAKAKKAPPTPMTTEEYRGYLKRIEAAKACPDRTFILQLYLSVLQVVEGVEARGEKIDRDWLNREIAKIIPNTDF